MMKTLLKVFAGIIVLLIVAVVGFVYTFDANNYKEEITDVAEAVTGRAMHIAGDLNISLYPWIGIKIHDVTIENPPGFGKKTFATIGQFDVRMKIIPLLQKRLDVDKLVLHHLEVDFEKNVAGESNWSDISGASENDNVESKYGLAGLSIGGIDITDSKLTWLDHHTGKQFKISKMSISTEAIAKGQSLPIELKAYVESNQPEWQAAINATAKLDFNDDTAVFDANSLKLAVKALLPNQQMNKVSFAMVADSTINLQTQTAKLKNTRLSTLGLVVSGAFDVENIFSVPVIQGPLKVNTFEADALAKHFKVDIPQMANAQSLKDISLTTSFKTDFNTVYLDDIDAKVDNAHVKGFVHIAGAPESMVRYDLKADKINLDDYRLVSKDPGQDDIPLPLDFIKFTDLDGVLDVETVTRDDIELKQFHMVSNIESGILNANPITMQVNDAEVKAAIRLDVREKPAAMFTAKVANMDTETSINPLLKNILGDEALTLNGRVNADAKLSAKGSSVNALKTSAWGTITLNMDKVIVKGIDFDHASQSVVVDYAQRNDFRVSRTFNAEYIPDRETEFNSLSATFKVLKGKMVNNDLLLVSDHVNVTGKGSIDFINGKLDYRPVIDMNVKSTVNIRDKLRDHPMQYRAHGSLGELAYQFDVGRYDLHMGRLMLQEAKANKNRRINSQTQNSWKNVLSK